jgi:PPM family protein phosphatase
MSWVRDAWKKPDHPTPDPPSVALGPGKPTASSPKLTIGYASDVGRVRHHNEDVLLTLETSQVGDQAIDTLGWFALADGMGGHQSGERASALAVRVVTHSLLTEILPSYLFNETRDASQPSLSEVLVNAVQAANRAVHAQVPDGGTTLTCALVLGSRLYLAHVGDSRAYLFDGDKLRQITRDHSLVDRLVELGQISSDEALNHPQRNVLYRAVGQGEALEVDTYIESLPRYYRLLLCCDGLWGMVSDDQLTQVIRSASTPQEACDRLVELANGAGGKDNITVAVVEP